MKSVTFVEQQQLPLSKQTSVSRVTTLTSPQQSDYIQFFKQIHKT